MPRRTFRWTFILWKTNICGGKKCLAEKKFCQYLPRTGPNASLKASHRKQEVLELINCIGEVTVSKIYQRNHVWTKCYLSTLSTQDTCKIYCQDC